MVDDYRTEMLQGAVVLLVFAVLPILVAIFNPVENLLQFVFVYGLAVIFILGAVIFFRFYFAAPRLSVWLKPGGICFGAEDAPVVQWSEISGLKMRKNKKEAVVTGENGKELGRIRMRLVNVKDLLDKIFDSCPQIMPVPNAEGGAYRYTGNHSEFAVITLICVGFSALGIWSFFRFESIWGLFAPLLVAGTVYYGIKKEIRSTEFRDGRIIIKTLLGKKQMIECGEIKHLKFIVYGPKQSRYSAWEPPKLWITPRRRKKVYFCPAGSDMLQLYLAACRFIGKKPHTG